MGVDLTLLPQSWRDADGCIHAHSALSMSRDHGLWEAIEESGIELELTRPTTCHFARTKSGKACFGEVSENPYGSPLTWCFAGQLYDVLSASGLDGDNVWVAAALKAMNPSKVIVLYWH